MKNPCIFNIAYEEKTSNGNINRTFSMSTLKLFSIASHIKKDYLSIFIQLKKKPILYLTVKS